MLVQMKNAILGAVAGFILVGLILVAIDFAQPVGKRQIDRVVRYVDKPDVSLKPIVKAKMGARKASLMPPIVEPK